jgi:hypothetical protein
MRRIADSNSLIKKWEYIGLLKYAQNPKIMAYCLEFVVKTLPESDVNNYNALILPLVFRVINNISPKFRRECRVIIKDIVGRFPNFMLNNYNTIDDLMSVAGLDWESEMCQLFVEEYLRIYENNKSIR